MSRKGASVTQADIARIIRAAKQEGVASVELKICDDGTTIVIRVAEFPPKRTKLLADCEDLNL